MVVYTPVGLAGSVLGNSGNCVLRVHPYRSYLLRADVSLWTTLCYGHDKIRAEYHGSILYRSDGIDHFTNLVSHSDNQRGLVI